MNLSDDQLRSLRAITQCNGPRDCAGTEKGCVTCGGYVPGLSHDELLSLVEEVEVRRQRCNCGPDGCHEEHPVAPCLPCRSLDGEMPCIYEAAIDALVAKTEAGKGLAGYAWHHASCRIRYGKDESCDCGRDAALARWEAANAE